MSPSDAAWQQLISVLHASGRRAALAITGGGSGAIGALLRVPGGSRLLIEAQVPYDEQALSTFLGFVPAQACSSESAIALAVSARARAAKLAPASSDLVGLGATAALVSDRPRKGEHRFHIAFANATGIARCTGVLAKGRRDRAAEEDLVSRAIVLWLARACGLDAASPRSLLDADEHFAETVVAAVDTIDQLLAGEVDRVTVQPDGQMMLSAPRPAVVLPGSFNPLHEGHVSLARIAEEFRQQPVAFEISVTNVDKPPLAGDAVRQRIAQFVWRSPVELTRAPTFLEKSRLFPKATFVIGADTAERLVARKYYSDDEDRMHLALEEIANAGVSFLVAVRIDAAGRLRVLNDIRVPRRFAELFTEIPQHRFRFDSSSTEIRTRRRGFVHSSAGGVGAAPSHSPRIKQRVRRAGSACRHQKLRGSIEEAVVMVVMVVVMMVVMVIHRPEPLHVGARRRIIIDGTLNSIRLAGARTRRIVGNQYRDRIRNRRKQLGIGRRLQRLGRGRRGLCGGMRRGHRREAGKCPDQSSFRLVQSVLHFLRNSARAMQSANCAAA